MLKHTEEIFIQVQKDVGKDKHFNAGTLDKHLIRPGGTVEVRTCAIFGNGTIAFPIPSAVPAGLMFSCHNPGVETPGYFRVVPLGRRTAIVPCR